MLRLFYAQLPAFARPDNPIMRYTLLRDGRRTSASTRFVRALISALLLIVLLILGYQIATGFGSVALDDAQLNALDSVFLVLYWPLIILQIGARLLAISATTGVIAAETRTGTWESLKITTEGAKLTMRARWASVFYRLRYVLLLIVAARVFFVIVALINFTSFQGQYLDLMVSGTTPLSQMPNPIVSLALSVLLASLTMVSALLLPFTAIAFDASLGMLIGTIARGRWLGILGQVVILLVRLVISSIALWIGALALSFSPLVAGSGLGISSVPGGGPLTWLGTLFGLTEGDLGLTLLHLPHLQRVWADIDYGILIGLAVLLYALLQAALSQAMIRLAAWRAAHADRV